MKISVLIPTHNRPLLFKRCIDSVMDAYARHNVDLEIIVNNDDDGVVEVHTDMSTYYYDRSDDLSDIYRGLFMRASKEYVYFLEDDDIMCPDFFETLDMYDEDIFYFNYIPYMWHNHFINFFGYTNNTYTKQEFIDGYDPHNFQFGQICFKKKCLDVLDFPCGNVMDNDYKIFKSLSGSFRCINKFLYKQTVDGGDNISFGRG